MSDDTLGKFARERRLAAGLGLRQAARLMNVSATYLSRVENDTDPPSAMLQHKMSEIYETAIGEFASRARARAGDRSAAAAHGLAMESSAELRALYRMGTRLSPEKVQNVLRKMLLDEGYSEEEIERELASLRSELPRVSNSARDGLFAAEARPRFLTKGRIAHMARQMLLQNGLTQEAYVPPTPIELLVENEPGILYRIDNLKCDKHGNPLVLGLTGWDYHGNRQIVINSALADSNSKSDEHRFNFTLAHELFHAVEHLPRVPKEAVPPMARTQVLVDFGQVPPRSRAEKAVNRWTRNGAGPRGLTTDEDWREWQSNIFASAVLMPDWAVVAEFRNRVGPENVLVGPPSNQREVALKLAGQTFFELDFYENSLADLFGVSRQAMAIRLLQLGLVEEVAAK